MKKTITIILVVLGITVFGFRYFSNKSKNIKVETAKVARGNLKETFTISGEIDARKKATLRFQTSGKLAWVKATEGDSVVVGQALAGLDLTNLKATENTMFYKYKAADANAKQIEDSVKGHDADETFTQKNTRVTAQTARDIAYDNWMLARQDSKNATLYSPITGKIISVTDLAASSYISGSTAFAIQVVDPLSLFFSASADQTEVAGLTEGKMGTLILDAVPDSDILGTIRQISYSPQVGNSDTTYSVSFYFDSKNTNYRLGMTGDIQFVKNEKNNTLFLPTKFIKNDEDKKYIYNCQSKNDKCQIYVETGLEADEGTEIVSGLKEGDVVYE